jgi:hypothetical protein
MSKTKNVYEEFHGHTPRKVTSINFHNPQKLVYLGKAVSIVYECDKENGGGDGQLWEYEHKFSKTTHLYTDETAKQLFILGAKLKVTDRGIEN